MYPLFSRRIFLEDKKGLAQGLTLWNFGGSPKGNRTPVFAVRGRYPRPLDDGTVDKIAARFYITRLPPLSNEKMAGGRGFEPRLMGPEPIVLPLNDPPAEICYFP